MRTAAIPILLAACGAAEEPASVALPVEVAGGPLAPATTDLGYEVTVTRLRAAIADLELTIAGETHDAVEGARFHPGHSAGGEVTGELAGDFILDWGGDAVPLGEATLIVGAYQGANWTWRAADDRDGLDADDPLLGHTFHVQGVASRDGADHPFDAVLDLEAGTSLVGAPFLLTVTEASTETLAITMLPTDPFEEDTAFDGVEFADVPEIRPGDPAANVMRRPLQTHDHYTIFPEER